MNGFQPQATVDLSPKAEKRSVLLTIAICNIATLLLLINHQSGANDWEKVVLLFSCHDPTEQEDATLTPNPRLKHSEESPDSKKVGREKRFLPLP